MVSYSFAESIKAIKTSNTKWLVRVQLARIEIMAEKMPLCFGWNFNRVYLTQITIMHLFFAYRATPRSAATPIVANPSAPRGESVCVSKAPKPQAPANAASEITVDIC